MPIVDFTQPNEFTKIITWAVQEEDSVLFDSLGLSQSQTQKYNQLTSKRKSEYLGLLACLQAMNLSHLTIFYNNLGKPWIKSNLHISISHSHGLVSLAVSDFPVGVDIELLRPEKIINIKKKFVREDEWLWMQHKKNLIDYLHIVWGVKEGLYKLEGGNLWNFLHHYRVEEFALQSNSSIDCWISNSQKSRKYFASYKIIQNHYLIWVVDYE